MVKRRFLAAIPLAALCFTDQLLHAQTLSTLASFNTANGSEPYFGLVADSAGNLYGTTGFGGTNGDGTIFELSGSNHQTLTTLFNFNSSNGAQPFGALVEDSAGNFYGTTEAGGADNSGTVFEIPAGNPTAVTTLFSFNNSSGTKPFAGLTLDSSGNLYGTTTSFGASKYGTVFELSGTGHQTFTLLASFNLSDGSSAQGGLVIDSAGNIYGTTAAGGANSDGTVFRLSGTNHKTLTTLLSFNGSNGSFPAASLTIGPDGNLYGTTAEGGSAGDGTVFRLSGTNFQTITTLLSFNGTNGSTPYAPVIADAAGNLFGTTQNGGLAGGNNGTIFQLSGTNYQNFTQIAALDGTLSEPRGALYNDSSGSLYGTTLAGGANGSGAAFEVTETGFLTYLPPLIVTGSKTLIAPPPDSGITITPFQALILYPGAVLTINQAIGGIGSRRVFEDHSMNISNGLLNLGNNDVAYTPIDSSNFNSSSSSNSGGIVFNGNSTNSNLANATSAVAAGYNNGNWNGSTGITSTTAADDTTHLTAIGVIQNNQSGTPIYTSSNRFDGIVEDPGSVLFKYTYYGDANLDGKVDGSDYSLIDAGYLSQGALTGWFYGDFNYDGVIDGSDYALIDNSFNRQGSAITASLDAIPTTMIDVAPAGVPEPAMPAAVTVVAVIALLTRRAHRAAE
jgi:uncharacterized repeat protein (TIGR03803 family)